MPSPADQTPGLPPPCTMAADTMEAPFDPARFRLGAHEAGWLAAVEEVERLGPVYGAATPEREPALFAVLLRASVGMGLSDAERLRVAKRMDDEERGIVSPRLTLDEDELADEM